MITNDKVFDHYLNMHQRFSTTKPYGLESNILPLSYLQVLFFG